MNVVRWRGVSSDIEPPELGLIRAWALDIRGDETELLIVMRHQSVARCRPILADQAADSASLRLLGNHPESGGFDLTSENPAAHQPGIDEQGFAVGVIVARDRMTLISPLSPNRSRRRKHIATTSGFAINFSSSASE